MDSWSPRDELNAVLHHVPITPADEELFDAIAAWGGDKAILRLANLIERQSDAAAELERDCFEPR